MPPHGHGREEGGRCEYGATVPEAQMSPWANGGIFALDFDFLVPKSFLPFCETLLKVLEKGNGNLFQYHCLENPWMDKGAS